MSADVIDYAACVGLSFYRWTVTRAHVSKGARPAFDLRCLCGRVVTDRDASHVVRGLTRGCRSCQPLPIPPDRLTLPELPRIPVGELRAQLKESGHRWHKERRRIDGHLSTVDVCGRCGMERGWPGGQNPCGRPVMRVLRVQPEGDEVAA